MFSLIDRTRANATIFVILLIATALLACKKGGSSDDEVSSDESAESVDTKQGDETQAGDEDADEDDSSKGDDAQVVAKDSVAGAFKVGDPVDVEWKGDWWKAEVKRVRSGPAYYIHYAGWGNEWDEWVGPRRIRARTAGSRTN